MRAQERPLIRLSLLQDAVGPIARGHPWLYRDGLSPARVRPDRPPVAGDPAELLDPRGRRVAFGLYDDGPIVVRVLGRDPEPLEPLLQRRLTLAWDRRRLVGADTDCFRVCNGEGDALPGLIVDRYGALLVVRLYSAAWVRYLDAIVGVLRKLPGITSVLRRFGVDRVDGREGTELLAGPAPADTLVVREHGMKLLVRPYVGQKTGLFLDQREHRRLIRGWAAGRTVLNLFSYNGGFSVAAALGGATRVVSVDIAAPALDDARENFRLNGLDPGAHGFEAVDAFRYAGRPADLVVCDPPSLTHGKDQDNAARTAYRDLHRHVAGLCTELLATSSCTARLSLERWEETVRDGLKAGWSCLHRSAEPPDHPVALAHPEGRYLKFLLLARTLR